MNGAPIGHFGVGVSALARKTVSDDFKVFSERLSKLMKERRLKQQDLASVLGVKRQTVSLYMSGQSMPDAEQLKKMAVFFRVSADWLLGLTDFRDRKNSQVLAKDLGLSEHSIEVLSEYVEHFEGKYLIPTINLLIEQETMPPDSFAVCFAPGMSEDEQNELTQEAEKVYEEEYEAWEKNKYVPIIEYIESFLSIERDSEKKYDITKSEILPKKRGGGLKAIRLNGIRTIPAADIAEKILLSDIEDGLKKLKKYRLPTD